MNMFDLEGATQQQMSELKLWLFRESVRIEMAKQELEEIKKGFEKEKKNIVRQLEEQHDRQVFQEKQLNRQKELFEKQWKVLQRGFHVLHADRQKQERDRQYLESEKSIQKGISGGMYKSVNYAVFFRGVSSDASLKKRYRELMKIFHPDNPDGDTDAIQKINKEYAVLKKAFGLEN